MKKHLLFLLMLVVTTLTAITFLISTYAFKAQERTMASMMRSYLLDLVDGFDEAPANSSMPRMGRGRHGMMRFRMLSPTSPLQNAANGGILLVTGDGKILAASPGAERLLKFWTDKMAPMESIKSVEPVEVRDTSGQSYYMTVRELQEDRWIIAAVSKTHILAPLVSVSRFWMASISLTSAVILLGVGALWKYLVVPMRLCVESIKKMSWGKERPVLPSTVFFELRTLSAVIMALAEEAIVKDKLKISYVSDLVRAQEAEASRLARELHDSPLQGVVAAIKRIQLAREAAGKDNRAEKDLATAEDVCQHAANEIRNYCDALSPSWVKLGLSSALYENIDRLSRVYGVVIDSELDERVEASSEEHVLALVRILQEAVSNSVRHGLASHILVTLEKNDGGFLFSIQDNGKGFDSATLEDETSYERLRTTGHRGLANMNERVQMLRGKMQLQTLPGQGCRTRIEVSAKNSVNSPEPTPKLGSA